MGTPRDLPGLALGCVVGIALMVAAMRLQARVEWRPVGGWGTLLVAIAVAAVSGAVVRWLTGPRSRFGAGIVLGSATTLAVVFLALLGLGLTIGS